MKRLFSLILAVSLLFSVSSPVFEPVSAESSSSENFTEAVQQSSLLLKLKQTLAQLQYRHFALQNNVKRAESDLVEIDEAIAHLESVIASLDQQIKDANRNILSVKSQTERKKMELEALEEDAKILELQLEDQKARVQELMALLYVKRDIFFDSEGVNAVKVLASPDSISKTLQNITYLDLIEAENQRQVAQMIDLSETLSDQWDVIRSKRQELNELDERFSGELSRLEEEKAAQEKVLEETKGEKAVLESMLLSADDREEDLLREIKIYEDNVAQMESQLAGTRAQLSIDEQDAIATIEAEMLEEWDTQDVMGTIDFAWPSPPSGGLTAFFHDTGYAEQFGVDHYAVDFRAQHGTALYAPADGVVYNVVFDPNSTAYAYIMIAHRMGMMSLVGHVSDVAVHAGQYVQQGDLIGLSGGTPGAIGTGYRSTGPHIHFELWADGVRVDPLLYLPLDEVPRDSLPERYLSQMQSQLEDQIREIQESLGL